MTPVLLGILSYIKFSHPLKTFVIVEIILVIGFFALTPVNVFMIFVLTTLTTVLVSFYAGDDFIWYRILSNQPYNTL